jgi:hypothetical protein
VTNRNVGDESQSKRPPEMELRMNVAFPRTGPHMLLRNAVLSTITVIGISCVKDNSVYPVASAGQGGVTVRKEEGPPPSVRPAPTAPAGPTARELELQRKIESMEARSRELEDQSRALQAELERLKKEAAK